MKPDFMQEALRLANVAAQIDEVPVGAVIVQNGRIVGRGYNRRESTHNPTSHAEIEAIQDASKNIGSWRLDGCEMFVTLEPCPMCLAALMHSRIKKVTYGAHDPKGGSISLGIALHQHPKLNHRFEAIYTDQYPESGQILTAFFKSLREK